MTNKQNIFLIGSMGAGKSTIGKQLAKELDREFYDADKEIELQAGANIPWIFDVEGEAGFRKREEQIIDELTKRQAIVLATGGGVVLAATNRAVLSSRGTVIYLQVSLEQQIKRVDQSGDRPLIKSGDMANTLRKLQAQRGPLYQGLADLIINTDNLSPKAIVQLILKKLCRVD